MAPGQIATLILPADTAWGEAEGVADTPAAPAAEKPSKEAVVAAAKALKKPNSMLFIGGRALRARGLELAGKIAAKTGCKVQGAGGTARIERGAGRIPVLRLHFVIEQAQAQLKGTQQMVLCGAKAPFAFFAYPGKPSVLTPDGCETTVPVPRRRRYPGLARSAGDGTRRDEREGRGRCPAEPSGASDRQVHARRPSARRSARRCRKAPSWSTNR